MPSTPITYRRPGVVCVDHVVAVPLDHDDPDGRRIEVFAREVVAADKERAALPYLLFLQGGPGGKAERPAPPSGWLTRALRDFRVVLLDQRGTGRSTPANRQSLGGLSPPSRPATSRISARTASCGTPSWSGPS